MNKSDKGFIIARNLRRDLEIDFTECIDLEYVAERLAIRIRRKDLGAGIEGACKSKGIKRLIVLKPNPYSVRKERFTISHEIGHLLIHHSTHICSGNSFYTYKTQSDEEREANNFAVELLLPRSAILDIFTNKDLTFSLVEEVAGHYQTSLSVAAIRLTQLFNDSASILWHDGHHISWIVKSDDCYLKISDIVSPLALAHKTSDEIRTVIGNVNTEYWIGNGVDVDNLICEEQSHYFSKLKKYLTILKFYEDY